jgi:hypothetical protein
MKRKSIFKTVSPESRRELQAGAGLKRIPLGAVRKKFPALRVNSLEMVSLTGTARYR